MQVDVERRCTYRVVQRRTPTNDGEASRPPSGILSCRGAQPSRNHFSFQAVSAAASWPQAWHRPNACGQHDHVPLDSYKTAVPRCKSASSPRSNKLLFASADTAKLYEYWAVA